MPEVSVAIPVRNGGTALSRTLAAVCAQTIEHELLVCDSGSSDGSVDVALSHGARVLQIDPSSFSHGGVRNLLMRDAEGARVAFLTQDAQPADEHWLQRLLGGFELAEDVAIVYGPYLPRPHAALPVRIELERWFSSLSPDGRPRVERLGQHERSLPAVELIGRRGFFSDANGCVARAAWEQVPFREVPYAEDRVLALDMLRAGFAKAYVPAAAVLHSHDYSTLEQLRRSFDEWRGLREVYGWREPARPTYVVGQLRGELGHALREPAMSALPPVRRLVMLAGVGRHHMVRLAGALLGSRADLLPSWLRRRLSLERRASFIPSAPSIPANLDQVRLRARDQTP
jgi:rhamnosyltransferase